VSLFDSGCDDGAAGLATGAAAPPVDRLALVNRYMSEIDRELARTPGATSRRRAWGTLYSKWREFYTGGGLDQAVARRYEAVAGAFAADLGARAPAKPAPSPPPPPAKTSHWLRWTLVAGGLGVAGYCGWRWYAGRAAPRHQLAAQEEVRVLTANPAHNPPVWVRDEPIWNRAKSSVKPYWDRYHDPYAVVTEVYQKLGGRIADRPEGNA
jgi:hypothetical protein